MLYKRRARYRNILFDTLPYFVSNSYTSLYSVEAAKFSVTHLFISIK